MPDPRQTTLRLMWSLWSEMGVPGVERRHTTTAIDPEPLIAWTPHLAKGDSRLLGLAFDWCLAHAQQVARVRLPGLAKTMSPAASQVLAAFNGSLHAHGVDWRPRSPSSDFARERETMALPLERPSLVRFRLRALASHSARADTLALLLASDRSEQGISQLTPPGMTRRSVERVIAQFAATNLVVVTGSDRHRRFRLREPEALSQLVQAQGLAWIDWHAAFLLAAALFELSELKTASTAVLRVEAVKTRKTMVQLARKMRLPDPPGPPEREDLAEALIEWGSEVLARIGL